MIRRIIHIDQQKCNGCGACAAACHEGAIEMVNGKARLAREDYCDGLGDCLPACPAGAITFEEREAPAYDEAAVLAAKAKKAAGDKQPCGCPGTASRAIAHDGAPDCCAAAVSRLSNWPVQLRLAPLTAPYYQGADLLIAADCTAYAYGDFHAKFMRGRVTLVGCPKLDEDYAPKLAEIFRRNDIASITLARMSVPCCGGLVNAVRRAIEACGKEIPLTVAVIGTDGRLISA